MTTTVNEAIYRMKYEGLDQAYQAAAAISKVTVEDEKLDKATRASAASFERTLGKLNPSIQAYQQYQRTLDQVARYEAAGIGTEQQRALLIQDATQKYAARTAALGQAIVANDNYNRSAEQTISIQQRINDVTGAGRTFDTAGRAADIAAYGQALDQVRAKYNPLYAASQQYRAALAEINQALRVGAVSEFEHATAVSATRKAYTQQISAIRAAGNAYTLADRRAGAMGGSLGQLSFQINDVVSGVLMGQRPFQIFAQQGGQIFQVWQMNTNVFKELKDAIAGFAARTAAFLGPLGLVAVGFAAAGAAAIAFYELTKKEEPKTADLLKEHARLLGVIKDAYDKNTNAVSKFYDQSKNVTLLQEMQQQIDLQQKLNEAIDTGLAKFTETDWSRPLSGFLEFGVKVKDQYKAFSGAIDQLAASAEKGAPDIKTFTDEIATIALANPALQKAGAEMVKAFTSGDESAQKLAFTLKQVKTIIDLIHNGGAVSQNNRDLLGIGGGAGSQINAYDQLIQRTKDHIDELKEEAKYAGLAAHAAEALKLQHDAERAAKKAGVAVNQQVLDQLKHELVLSEREKDRAKIQADVNFQRKINGLSPEDAEIAKQLRSIYPNVTDALNSFEASQIRANNRVKEMLDLWRGAKGEFASSFNSSLRSGATISQAVGAGINAAGTHVSNSLMTTALSTGNPVAAAGAVAISFLQGQAEQLKQKYQQEQQEYDQAQKAWADNQAAYSNFVDQLNGKGGGSLIQGLADAQSKAQQFADTASKAGHSIGDIQAAMRKFTEDAVRNFIQQFDLMIEAMNQGLGQNSPALQAAQNVKSIGDSLKGYLQDVKTLSGSAYGVARDAAQKYALSLLQTQPDLTDTEKRLLEIRGASQQLALTLQDLGLSAEQAAKAVSDGVTQALDALKSKFTSDIQSTINEASGKGYINQINDLITTTLGQLQDAQYLGVDPTLIAHAFDVQVQKIVDDAGVVGSAFSDLQKQFPQLVDVIQPSTTALDNLTKSIASFLNQIGTGDLSVYSPLQKFQAAKTNYRQTLALAQGGNSDAISSITQVAQDFLTQARDFFASSPDYANVFNQIVRDLSNLPSVLGASKQTTDILKNSLNVSQQTGNTITDVKGNTGNTVTTLDALRSVQAATQQSSVDISDSVTKLGQQNAYVATAQGSQYFQPMINLLQQVVHWTSVTAQNPVQLPQKKVEWWNPFTWFHDGGIVGRYAPGGIVGNGLHNQDSVLARYAGGGNIMLAGGEGIINAAATQMVGPSVIDLINRTGRLPAASNDNRPELVELLKATVRGNQMLADRLDAVEAAIGDGFRHLGDSTRRMAERKPVPGGNRKTA